MKVTGETVVGEYADKSIRPVRQAPGTGAIVIGRNAGRYRESSQRGCLFNYSTAAAGVVIAGIDGTNNFTIWNPMGSGKLLVPLRIMMGVVSGASAIAGTIAIYRGTNLGGSLGTGAPVSVFTAIAAENALVGGGNASVMRFSTTNTQATAPSLFRTCVWTQLQARSGGALIPMAMGQDTGGMPIIAPGACFTLASTSALAWTMAITVLGAEIPMPRLA